MYTFEYDSIVIQFERTTNADGLKRLQIVAWLRDRQAAISEVTKEMETGFFTFAALIVPIREATGLPFDVLAARTDPHSAWQAYEAWLKMPEDFSDELELAMRRLRRSALVSETMDKKKPAANS